MKKFFGLAIIPLGLVLAGCATCDKTRIDSLEARVQTLEAKTPAKDMASMETKTTTATETQAPAVEAPDSPTKADIQGALKNAGFYEGEVDGKMGPKTKKAIEAFQTANELVADGKVGPNTWNKLKKYYTAPVETKGTK